jgi:hypothetical protein
MNFKKFYIEAINFNSREVIVAKGEVLYHGTIESFDTRKARPSAYDDIFWTSDDMKIARTYIPAKSSYMNTSLSSILRDKEHEGIRKSLGITPQIIKHSWLKQEEGYNKLKYWEEKYKEFNVRYKELERTKFDDLTDEFFSQWAEAEKNYKNAEKEMRWHDHYLKIFVIHKMKAFGYEPTGYSKDYFTKIMTDDKGNLLPMTNRSIGKVLKVICNRDFKFYNMAYGKEGDLMDVDYHKLDIFRKIEEKGYDGVIINDFAQSEYHGNYGHLSVGFFKSAMKDLTIKQIRNQTHPTEKDWKD